jgi:uncharacterized Fe-S center protein
MLFRIYSPSPNLGQRRKFLEHVDVLVDDDEENPAWQLFLQEITDDCDCILQAG